ncbi:hypothetical protein EDB89DRAFT_1980748 [Lactarius sanguifluus]|nr:hypothetical protein EDB89DRAFT_1980748 [Lactarius sanguifluus]
MMNVCSLFLLRLYVICFLLRSSEKSEFAARNGLPGCKCPCVRGPYSPVRGTTRTGFLRQTANASRGSVMAR